MDNDRVRMKFAELWDAVYGADSKAEAINQIRQEEAENAAKKHAAEFYGGKDRVAKVAQHDHERKMAGNYEQRIPTRDYGVPTNAPTPKTYTVWEALERTEKAREELHIVINELNARLEGVVSPEEPTTAAAPSPGGIGVAFRTGLNAASIEDAIYRLRNIINRLTI